MLHGTQLEPAARAAYERQTGLVMQPLVLVDGEYSASLDGLTLAGERHPRDQVPVQGPRLDAVEDRSKRAGCPSTTSWQVQHQLMVSKADIADVFVFDGTEGIRLPGRAGARARWPRIHEAWDSFMRCVAESRRRR